MSSDIKSHFRKISSILRVEQRWLFFLRLEVFVSPASQIETGLPVNSRQAGSGLHPAHFDYVSPHFLAHQIFYFLGP